MREQNRTVINPLFSWGLPLVIAASYVFLSLQHDLRLSIPSLIGTTAIVVSALAVLLYTGERGRLNPSPGLILLLAFFFRLLFVFRTPELSDDMYRYLWDGLQTLRGMNPYALAPAAAKAYGTGSAVLFQKINHPDLVTIYPPVSQMVFAAGAAVSHSLTGLKILFVIVDMVTCFLILKIVHTLNLPAWRAALYAWHPLPVIEIAGSGHVDGLGILFLLAMLSMFFRHPVGDVSNGFRRFQLLNLKGSSFMAGLLFATSVLVKFVPLIYLPVLLLADRAPVLMFAGFGAGLILLCASFVPDFYLMFATLGTYLQHWEFSNFLFRTLRSLTSSGDYARLILCSILTACIVSLAVLYGIRRRGSDNQESIHLLLKALYGVTFAFLLLTPTLYPWYVLYLVALFPFAVGPAGLVLGWAVFLSYGVLIDYALTGRWVESALTTAGIWFSPAIAFLVSKVVDRAFSRKCKGLGRCIEKNSAGSC